MMRENRQKQTEIMQSRHKSFSSPCEQVRIWGRVSKTAHLVVSLWRPGFLPVTHSLFRLYALTTLEQDGPADQRISSQTPHLMWSLSVIAVTFSSRGPYQPFFPTSCCAYYLKPCRTVRSGQKCFECDHCVPKQIARPSQTLSM